MSVNAEERTDRGRIEISEEECKGCGLCIDACPPRVIEMSDRLNGRGYHPASYVGTGCTACGICFYACPEPGAITVYTVPKNGGATARPPRADALQ
jgi:NAD-dependent dihydropyrimidine dehydrogenase PreA subunit